MKVKDEKEYCFGCRQPLPCTINCKKIIIKYNKPPPKDYPQIIVNSIKNFVQRVKRHIYKQEMEPPYFMIDWGHGNIEKFDNVACEKTHDPIHQVWTYKYSRKFGIDEANGPVTRVGVMGHYNQERWSNIALLDKSTSFEMELIYSIVMTDEILEDMF